MGCRIPVAAGAAVVMMVGCATQPHNFPSDPPGFFTGLLHGFVILFSIIGSVFLDIRIYAFPNSGWFYDLGFFIGSLISIGGMTAGGASQ